MTTIPLYRVYVKCVLSLRWPLPFSTGGVGHMDGRMDGQKSPNNCSNPPPVFCIMHANCRRREIAPVRYISAREALHSLHLRTVWGVAMYAGVSIAHMDFANLAQKPNTLLAWLSPQATPPGLMSWDLLGWIITERLWQTDNVLEEHRRDTLYFWNQKLKENWISHYKLMSASWEWAPSSVVLDSAGWKGKC